MMDELDDELKNHICDALEGFELVEYLDISIEDIVELFEDEILENLEDVLEFIGLKNDEDEYEANVE